MIFQLSDEQLDAFREMSATSYHDTAVIYKPVRTADTRGNGERTTYEPQYSSNFEPLACRAEMNLQPPKQIVVNNQIQTQTWYTIFFEFYVVLEPGYKVVVNGIPYLVNDSNSHANRQVATFCTALRTT